MQSWVYVDILRLPGLALDIDTATDTVSFPPTPPNSMHNHLIIFTRYPEPGKTKTRLIPALGAEGAANLQRQMTEYTLCQVQQLQNQPPKLLHSCTPIPSIEVRFAGGNLQLMQDWLGTNLVYQLQGEGDLGMRMMRSLVDAFQLGAEKVVIIGIDCPGINAQILAQAFEQLHLHDLVLGPAIDGGYYLIGLQRPVPELFTNISWGTSEVLQTTLDIAQKLNLSVFSLPALADIDRPEDLHLWEKITATDS